MPHDRPSHRVRGAHAGLLVLLTCATVACAPGASDGRDSSGASASAPPGTTRADAGVAPDLPPRVEGERAGKKVKAGQPDASCADYDVNGENPGLPGPVVHGKESTALVDHVATLCFAVGADAMDREFHHLATGPLGVWIQPEMRMHGSDPRDLADGSGMVVGKIRNEKFGGGDVELPRWERRLGPKTDALLWYGRQGEKRPAVLFEIQNDKRVRVIATGTWAFEEPTTTPHRFAVADWNPHGFRPQSAADSLKWMQQSGSGWISCKLGCCTALDVNVEP